MVLIKGFEFNLRELAGSIGDFGTLIPFTVGYVMICGFHPTGLLLGIGLTNIFLALIYKLPLPVQPKKVIGSVALSQKWPMGRVLGAGFTVGLIWIALSLSKKVNHILEQIPNCLVRGIQLGLAFSLVLTGAEMTFQNVVLVLPLMIVAFLLLNNRYIPSALFLVLFGFAYAVIMGDLKLNEIVVGFSIPNLHLVLFEDMVYGFIYAGFAQIFLTLTNAVVATVVLIHDLFPERTDVTPRNLIANMAAMNVVTPFIGGMPLCHGSGGLAAQYLFGARTGGAILMEGLIEISLGLFFSNSLLSIFTSFPPFIVGIMLIMTSLELSKLSLKIESKNEGVIMLFTALLSTAFNIAVGFVAGLLFYFVIKKGVIKQ